MDSDSRPVLDPKKIEGLRAIQRPGRPSLIERIVDIYRRESVEILQQLQRAIEQEESETLRQAAHRFKSVGGNIGAEELSALCQALEHSGRDQSWDGVPERYDRLTCEHERVLEALTQVLEEG